MIDVINYAISLSTIDDKKFINSMIGKIKYIKYEESDRGNLVYKSKEIKSNNRLSIIEITAFHKDIIKARMIVSIVLNSSIKAQNFGKEKPEGDFLENISLDKVFFKRFTKNEITEFSNLVHDYNPIHLDSEKCIVQGMNILNELVKAYHISSSFEIKFINPVYNMQDIYIINYKKIDKILFEGICRQKICFKMNFLGE